MAKYLYLCYYIYLFSIRYFFLRKPKHVFLMFSFFLRQGTCARVGVPYIDFKHCISQYISTWQDDWNGAVVNKLHFIKPVLGDWQSSYRRCREDEMVLRRTHIGHTPLIHTYILKKDLPPQCENCQCILTVRHISVECYHSSKERKDLFGRRDVVESFIFHPTLILFFLKQIEFYYKF